jgi:cell division inhibitor SepF
MAGAMRKMAVYLGLVEDDSYDDYADDYDEQGRPADGRERREGGSTAVRPVQAVRDDARPEPRGAAVATMTERRPAPTATTTIEAYRITTLQPRTYNEARTIGEHFREGTPVIMNLTEMDDGDAKRLVDFSAGLVFGLRGSIERVTNKVFLLSPANVDVTAEDKARIAEGGFFNQS